MFAAAAAVPSDAESPIAESYSEDDAGIHWSYVVAWVFLIWYILVSIICLLGHLRIRFSFNYPKPLPADGHRNLPFVTILRPICGAEPNLELCLNSACLQDYPEDLFEVVFCVADASDSAIPIIEKVISAHPDINTKLSIGEEPVGPNPKIRNLSRAYREARGDIVWILDSNVWINPRTLRRAVRLLEGTEVKPGYKVVHHLPIVVDVTDARNERFRRSCGNIFDYLGRFGGGRSEEQFMSSSHAKFYCAINTTSLAPCVVGKSNLFRRSHLAEATRDLINDPMGEREGINFFADNICEDHLITERLWFSKLNEEKNGTRVWRKHRLADDVVYQPIENFAVRDYIARRTRWIAVRKYSVLAATLVEPLTESVLASLLLAFSLTALPFSTAHIGSSWGAFFGVWLASMLLWALQDRALFRFIHQYRSTVVDENTPDFITRKRKRSLLAWSLQWMGREGLAFGIWAKAMWPGTVVWRGKGYRIRWRDMKVEMVDGGDAGEENKFD